MHPMDCSPPGSSVHGILQARTLEWVVGPSSRKMYKVLKVVIPIPAAETAGLDHRMIEGDHVGTELVSGEGNGNPLQYSCLENPMDGGVW